MMEENIQNCKYWTEPLETSRKDLFLRRDFNIHRKGFSLLCRPTSTNNIPKVKSRTHWNIYASVTFYCVAVYFVLWKSQLIKRLNSVLTWIVFQTWWPLVRKLEGFANFLCSTIFTLFTFGNNTIMM